MNHRTRPFLVAALLSLAIAQVSVAQAPTPGERWCTTMSMEAMGMKMPGQTTEVCAPKNASNSPPVDNDQCQGTNPRQKGKTLIVDMVCKNGMTGTMEMTQESPTRWNSRMVANTREGQMTMVMNSEKLPGECDASEMERKVNKMIKQGNEQQAAACLDAARSGNVQMFVGEVASCKDKASIDAFCGNAKTAKGYNAMSRQQRMATGRAASTVPAAYRNAIASTGKLCGFAPETVRKQLCSASQSKKEWTFFAEECPELADPIGKRECVGRDFTTPVAPAYTEFCSAWSSAKRGEYPSSSSGSDGSSDTSSSEGNGNTSAQRSGNSASGSNSGAGHDGQPADAGQGDKPKPTEAAKEALKKGKDALKGLFGR